jgi:hypothetical protein
MDNFSHGGYQSGHPAFAFAQQTFVKRLHMAVVADTPITAMYSIARMRAGSALESRMRPSTEVPEWQDARFVAPYPPRRDAWQGGRS